MTLKLTAAGKGKGAAKADVVRWAKELAAVVARRGASIPAEDRRWLAEPLGEAAAAMVDHLTAAWRGRADPAAADDHLARADAAVAEVQTWALLAVRHGHWSHRVGDDVDRRCEAILDAVHWTAHPFAMPAAVRRAA